MFEFEIRAEWSSIKVTFDLLLCLKAKFMFVGLIKYFINFDLSGLILPSEQNHHWYDRRYEGSRPPQTRPRWRWRSWWAEKPDDQWGPQCWWAPSAAMVNIILEPGRVLSIWIMYHDTITIIDPIMLVCYTLLLSLVLLLTFDIGKTIWTSSFLISSRCFSLEFLVTLLLLFAMSCSSMLCWMCWYLTCHTSSPPSQVSVWKKQENLWSGGTIRNIALFTSELSMVYSQLKSSSGLEE